MGYCSLTDRLLSSTHLPAMILALKVLPVPGGPSNRTARGRLLSKRDRVFRAMTSYTSCQARRDKTQRHPRYMTSSVLWYWMSYYFEIFLRTPYRTVYITPPCGGFPSSIARQPRGGGMPNDPSSESSRRDASNAELFGTDTIQTGWNYQPWYIGRGVCDVHRCRL